MKFKWTVFFVSILLAVACFDNGESSTVPDGGSSSGDTDSDNGDTDSDSGVEEPSMVWGELLCDQCLGPWNVAGKLAVEGEHDYYGRCRREGDRFSFVVADAQSEDLGVNEHFFEIIGISGTPTNGVYESGMTPKDGEEYERSFTGARIIYTNDWEVDEDQITDTCNIALFAKALVPEEGEPELTPAKYDPDGVGLEFDYYVRIDVCNGLDVPDKNDWAALTGFQLELWFDNCEEE